MTEYKLENKNTESTASNLDEFLLGQGEGAYLLNPITDENELGKVLAIINYDDIRSSSKTLVGETVVYGIKNLPKNFEIHLSTNIKGEYGNILLVRKDPFSPSSLSTETTSQPLRTVLPEITNLAAKQPLEPSAQFDWNKPPQTSYSSTNRVQHEVLNQAHQRAEDLQEKRPISQSEAKYPSEEEVYPIAQARQDNLKSYRRKLHSLQENQHDIQTALWLADSINHQTLDNDEVAASEFDVYTGGNERLEKQIQNTVDKAIVLFLQSTNQIGENIQTNELVQFRKSLDIAKQRGLMTAEELQAITAVIEAAVQKKITSAQFWHEPSKAKLFLVEARQLNFLHESNEFYDKQVKLITDSVVDSLLKITHANLLLTKFELLRDELKPIELDLTEARAAIVKHIWDNTDCNHQIKYGEFRKVAAVISSLQELGLLTQAEHAIVTDRTNFVLIRRAVDSLKSTSFYTYFASGLKSELATIGYTESDFTKFSQDLIYWLEIYTTSKEQVGSYSVMESLIKLVEAGWITSDFRQDFDKVLAPNITQYYLKMAYQRSHLSFYSHWNTDKMTKLGVLDDKQKHSIGWAILTDITEHTNQSNLYSFTDFVKSIKEGGFISEQHRPLIRSIVTGLLQEEMQRQRFSIIAPKERLQRLVSSNILTFDDAAIISQKLKLEIDFGN